MEIISKQKFFRGHRVYINPITDKRRAHFTSDCNAIILGSYRDIYHRIVDGNNYHLLLLNKENIPYTTTAWYPENELTLINSNRDLGEQIIQTYLDNK